MKFTPRVKDDKTEHGGLQDALEPVVHGLGMALIELAVSRRKGHGSTPASVQVRAVVYKAAAIGVDDCSKVHRAVMPRLELVFTGLDVYLEVSSPGIDRAIKDGSEFAHFEGRGVACYRTDISDWTGGILLSSDDKGIVLKTLNGEVNLGYDIIAKAKLDHSEEV
ncbi:ribosome maturation factor RimP [Spirochaetia bacterium]|nr:ribosome maturation factor RimP [Spirochaetia bacterium]